MPFSSCAIVTTTPNDLIAPIHDRMPLMLPKEAEAICLDTTLESEAALTQLRPYPADAMQMYEVSLLVNSVRNKGAELVAPVQRLA